MRMHCPVLLASLVTAGATFALAIPACAVQSAAAQAHAITRLYVFGDSYSDIGEGYLDGNGPTSVAYLAEKLGAPLKRCNDPAAKGDSLDYAISGAQTGIGKGHRIGDALLGYGMRNQVDDFAAAVRAKTIRFDSATTLFFIAGGLNDKRLPTQQTVDNLEGEIRTLYAVGGHHFLVALMPEAIPDFSEVGTRLNPALAQIPAAMNAALPGAHVNLSHWGPFYDQVMRSAHKYGITNTTDQCAGRAIFHQDTTPCTDPDAHYYYHHGHPSTRTHSIVGGMLYDEVMQLAKEGKL